MPQKRTLVWTIGATVVAAVAVVLAVIDLTSGPQRTAASPPLPRTSAGPSANPSATPSASPTVVIPRTSATSSFSYISDLTPDIKLAELIYPGPVTMAGSIYPKSISFYCYDGDPPAFPVYKLRHNARRFEATVGMEARWPSDYLTGVSILGDGRTLRTFNVSVLKPKTIDINVTGLHTLKLECFSPGISSAASAASVEVGWGNARVTEGR